MARRGRKRQLDAESLYWQLILSGMGTVGLQEKRLQEQKGGEWRHQSLADSFSPRSP
jgi:hypothetical protein